MKTQSQLFPVTRELVPEDQRLKITEKIFGMRYVLELEPLIFNITERMAEDYKGVRAPRSAGRTERGRLTALAGGSK